MLNNVGFASNFYPFTTKCAILDSEGSVLVLSSPIFTRKQLVQLAIPLIIEQMLTAAVGFADTLMVSNVGEAIVSGVSLVDSINMLLINIFAALATGGAVVVSQYIGMKEREKSLEAAGQVFWVTLVLSLVISVVSLLFRPQLLTMIFGTVEPLVRESALIYFLLSALSYPFIAQYNTCAALLRACGNSKVPMYTSLLMNVINISGNAILIYGFDMGAAGAGLATFLSNCVACGYLVMLLRNERYSINLSRLLPMKLNFRMIKNILGIGLPIGLENGIFQIGKVMVQSMVSSFGTAAIAATAVANSMSVIIIMPAGALGMALVTVAGQCAGAGEYEQCKGYIKKLTVVAKLTIIALSALLVIGMDPVLKMYNLSSETAVLARQIIMSLAVAASLLWAEGFVMPNGLRACSDVKFSMIVAISSMWTMRVGMGYVLSTVFGVGVIGVWYGMFLDWIVRVIAYGWRFFSGRWTRQKVVS